ncbi:MAG: FHA domain-containing protein [Planctomycetota bacterium]
MAKLVVEGDDPREIPLSEVCRIGRDKGNEVALEDPGLSRRHCRIFREGADYILEDLKSANGTFVEGKRVDRAKLRHGDRISLGEVTLLVDLEDSAGAPAAESELRREEPGTGARFELVFVAGERAGEKVRLISDRITFGRKSSNTVVLKDAKVSGVHCEVVLEDGRPVLRDLGSTNGTLLEGKRIDEIVLDHGDRLMLGESTLTLIDTSRDDVSEMVRRSVAASGAVDATQTMISMPEVHVVQNVGRARKNPLALIGLLLTLVALGAGGWFYWSLRGRNPDVVKAPPQPGNLLGERWSFESVDEAPDPSVAWDLGQEGFQVGTGGARSGQQFLVGEPAGFQARAVLSDPLKISGRKYRVSGYAKVKGEAVATLAAVFLRGEDEAFPIVVPVGSSGTADWQEMTAELVPPSGATRLGLILTAVGKSGEALFDDFEVFEAGVTRAAVETVNQFEFEQVGENLLVRRGNELLHIGPLAFTASGTDLYSADRFLHDGAVQLPGGAKVRYASSFSKTPRGAEWRLEWGGNGEAFAGLHLPVDLLEPLLEEPVGVLRGGVLEPYHDSFEADGTSGLVLGKGLTRMQLRFEPEVGLKATRQETCYRLEIHPPSTGGRLLIRAQVDFVEEKTKAGELVGAARTAQSERRLGEAISILEQIRNEFPFDETILEEAGRRENEIVRERERVDAELKLAVERAAFLKSPTAYREAEVLARAAADAFAGNRASELFGQTAAQLASERQAIVSSNRERSAASLLQRLETLLSQDPPKQRAAREIAEYLSSTFPGSEPAARALEMVRSADGS